MKVLINRIGIPVIFILVLVICYTAINSGSRTHASNDIEAVNQVIENFQNAYSARDIGGVQELFHHKAVVGIQFESNPRPDIMTLSEWIKETREIFESRIWISDELTNRDINIYRGTMATVVCDYEYKDPVSHQAGIDIFTLMKFRGEWKIVSLVFSGEYVK